MGYTLEPGQPNFWGSDTSYSISSLHGMMTSLPLRAAKAAL